MTYADTGFICSLLAPDANSLAAANFLASHPLPLAWTWLHEVEFRNAMRLRIFRKEQTQEEAERTIRLQLADLAGGVFRRVELNQPSLLTETERLSASHSARIGTRSLDVLHVAAALVIGAQAFITFDQRQSHLAHAAGLTVPSIPKN